MTSIDTVQICALLDAAANITGPKIAELYRRHGVGAEVEENVIRMLTASLDCLTRATELAAGHEPTYVAMLRRVEKMREIIADHQAQYEAWIGVPILLAMDEAERATKH